MSESALAAGEQNLAEPEKPQYVIVRAWGRVDTWDVRLGDVTVRREFASQAQAQSWINAQMEEGHAVYD
jgi:hypothetical protein